GSDGWPTTAAVGSFLAGASRWGPLDMAGNVAEWTSDWSDAGHKSRRVLGGSFLVQRPAWLSTADTSQAAPTRRDAVIGFRCVDKTALDAEKPQGTGG
ncbi:MAG: SUMF1/EgtB/PvdO family nonheme iron enzyme, partial [Nannocystaceae bacterium]|nr:SUMF1/EgtB/PvdO family nonheme iron enzyme [Nannocystaceae bacterium]